MASRILLPRKTIALVAHDDRKDDLIKWAEEHKDKLQQHHLIATGTTGQKVEGAIKHEVQGLLSGPLGGDQQLGSMIAEGKIDMIVFFWDALEPQPHDSDVKALQRLAVLWNIPIACNRATADFMISSPHMQSDYETQIPDTE